jgi:hypothetical protein
MCWSVAEANLVRGRAVVVRPVASVRARPDPRSELVTQEIYGRPIRLERVCGEWARCRCRDGSVGWLPSSYVHSPAGFRPGHMICRRLARLERRGASPLWLPMGAMVEVEARAGGLCKVHLPDGGEGSVGAKVIADQRPPRLTAGSFTRVIREVVGAPYVWGGTSTFGFDCSGLVHFLFGIFGVRLPRNSADQARRGREVREVSRLQPLDLIFFGKRGVDHVAIHLGRLRILHASGDVRIESLDPASPAFRQDLAATLRSVRRIVP